MTTFIVYRSEGDKQWYWHAKRRGRIVADGGEGYKRKSTLLKALKQTIAEVRGSLYRIEIP